MSDVSRETSRWYKLDYHAVQHALVHDDVRFKIVPAGRRSGKTERAKRYVVRRAFLKSGNYFCAAPTQAQAKQIFWDDLKALTFSASLPGCKVSETNSTIRLPNHSKIHVIGLDKPQRIEGINWAGGVVDEVADLKATAWAENIRPALDTRNPLDPEYKPWCWLIGVPDGFNHYYEMCQKVLRGELSDWKLYTWFSSDILAPDVIAAAKASMSPKQFRQEYEASFESAGNKIYEDYGAKNWVPTELQSSDEIMWMHDFNYTPLSSAIGVRRGDELHIVDEIVLTSAVARQAAQEFVERYSGHKHKKVVIYGDPAGRAGEPHGQRSNYIEIEELLMSAGWEVSRKVKLKAPSIKDRQNAVRAKILNANGGVSLFVNVAKCPYMHKGLATTQFKEGSAYLEQEGDYQHITTALGYCVDVEWPMYRQVKAIEVIDNPSLNYWQK